MKTYSVFAVMIVLAAGAFAAPARGESEAKTHFLKGKALVEEGAYDQAIVELKASYDLKPVAIVLYNIAVCYDEMHRFGKAIDYYARFLTEGQGESKALLDEVDARVKAIQKFIGQLAVAVDQAGAEVIVDGELIGISPLKKVSLETGEHDLLVRKTGFEDTKQKFTIVSGERTEIDVKMVESEAKGAQKGGVVKVVKPPKDQGKKAQEGKKPGKGKAGGKKKLSPVPFGVVMALAGCALVGAIATGALAIGKDGDVGKMSEDDPDFKSTRDEGRTLALTTDVLIGAGAAFALAAIVLGVYTDFGKGKGKKEKVSLTPLIGSSTAGAGIALQF